MTSHNALDQIDRRIAELERLLREAQAERREYINRHNLNKPKPYTAG